MASKAHNRGTRLVAGVLVLGLAAVLLLAVVGGDAPPRRVSFTVTNAANLYPGLTVRAAGQPVGKITELETVGGGRAARVELGITDEKVWPLPTDTRFRVRFGGTVAYSARYIAVDKGTSSAMLADGATVPAANVTIPVEFDEVFGTFGPATRKNLRRTVDTAGAALRPAAVPLRNALDSAPEVVRQARGLFGDLGARPTALAALVRSTDRIVDAANRASPGVGSLISDASTTFAAMGSREEQLGSMLERLPATLRETRATLAWANTVLDSATTLAGDLRPGVERLIDITPPLNQTLRTLRAVAPDATRTLTTVRRSSGDLRSFLDRARGLMPNLGSLGEQATKQVRCIRPYAPEIGGFLGTWTGFTAVGDGKDKIARLYNAVYPFPNDTPMGTGQASKLYPSAFLSYAFPRPPGANVNQPWFQPECHVTPAGLDPTKNPEDFSADTDSTKFVRAGAAK